MGSDRTASVPRSHAPRGNALVRRSASSLAEAVLSAVNYQRSAFSGQGSGFRGRRETKGVGNLEWVQPATHATSGQASGWHAQASSVGWQNDSQRLLCLTVLR
jgi:hypothetical protein